MSIRKNLLDASLLLCDDDNVFRLMVGDILRSSGFKVFEAANGREACEITANQAIDLALLDVDLPDFSGIELAKQLVSIPVLFVTQYGDINDIELAYSDPIVAAISVGYIVKPVDIVKFESTIASAIGVARQLNTQRQLLLAAAQGAEHEKSILARELHDELGGQLTMLRLEATVLRSHIPDNNEYIREHKSIEKILDGIDKIYRIIKNVIKELLPEDIESLGIKKSIQQLVRTWNSKTDKFEITVDIPDGLLEETSDEFQVAVYRIIQEIINNAVKHANATIINILIAPTGSGNRGIKIAYEDNGIGFVVDEVPEGHYGLTGMKERITSFGGNMIINSQPGIGTEYEIVFPIKYL